MKSLRGPLITKECAKCPLAVKGKPRPVRGIGPKEPRIIVLAEGPGQEEVRRGEPLIGPTGQLFAKALAKFGLKREDVWLGNVTLCQPPRGIDKDKAMPEAAECCHARTIAELKPFKAETPLLLLGKFAAQKFLGNKFKITELAGTYHEVEVEGLGKRRMIPTLHPAHILRGGGGEGGDGGAHATDLLVTNLIYDVAKAKSLGDGEEIVFSDDIFWEHEKPKRAEELIRRVCAAARKAGIVACDTETEDVPDGDCSECRDCHGHNALESYHARLHAIGFATEKYAVSVAWKILTPSALEMIRDLLADKGVAKVFHNRTYDMVVLNRRGYPVRGKVHDTLLEHHNAFPGLAHKLQRVATQFFAIGAWKAEFRHGVGDITELLPYNARDALTTARLHSRLQVCVKKSHAEKTYAMDLRMASVAERMTRWGIPVNAEVNGMLNVYLSKYTKKRYANLERNLDKIGVKKRFLDYLAVEKAKSIRKSDPTDFLDRHAIRMAELEDDFEFNLNTPGQVAALLLSVGVSLTSVTATGRVSTRKDLLETLATHPVVHDLLEWRSAEKLLGSFVKPMPYMLDKRSRFHVVWDVNKITGRWGSKPNVQNWTKGDWRKLTLEEWLALPEEKKGMPNLRTQVQAPKGRVFVGGDKAQLEARIIALLSGDEYLCRVFNEGIDIHSEVAKEIFPDYAKLDAKSDERARKRDVIKTGFYGYLYGAAVQTVWKTYIKQGFNVPISTVNKMFKTFEMRLPGVTRFHKRLFGEVLKTGCSKSFLLGRRREYPLGNAEPSVVLNFPIQSSGADIMNTGVWRFDQKRLPVKYIVQVHDAFIVECDEDDADMVKREMTDAFSQAFTVGGTTVEFPMDVKVGKSWDRVG